MPPSELHRDWLRNLSESRQRLLVAARAGRVDPVELRRVADTEARLALALNPMPVDPVAHLTDAHAQARPYLQRLLRHDPAVAVVVNDEGYSYTPRKILRRVLDHALDHLNQIEQWLAWQNDGQAPTPTDGWAGSLVTLDEDHMPLTAPELDAWLWRIDLTVQLMVRYAAQLSLAQLDWTPPDGGWNLRRVLHHVAAGELFYVVWLGEALPEDVIARYGEASRRFHAWLHKSFASPGSVDTAFFGGEIDYFTPEQVAEKVLEIEQCLGVDKC